MKTRRNLYHEAASPTTRVQSPVIRSLRAPGIRIAQIAWAVRKKRTQSSVLEAAAQLALNLPSSSSHPPASDTLPGSSHNEEPSLPQSSLDAEQKQQPICYTRRKFCTARNFQEPCVPTAAAGPAILPHNDYDDDDQDTTPVEDTTPDEDTIPVEEKSEESGQESPKAWRGPRSSRKKRDTAPPPPVSDTEDGNNGTEPDAAAAAAASSAEAEEAAVADVGRPRRQRKPKVFEDFENTDTPRFDWLTFYPNVPFPEDYDHEPDGMQLGEVEAITASEGGSSDISDCADKPFSLKLQTDTQKTRKARRILVSERNDDAPPKESSCSQTPDKLQESNGECEVEDAPPATPSESAAAEKDSLWTASEDDSTRNAGPHDVPDSVTIEVEISGRTPGGSRLKGFPKSMTFEANLKLKKKRPRPKVMRPKTVKVAMPAKIPKTTKRKTRPAKGASEHQEAAAAAAVRDHSVRATAAAEFVKPASSKRQRQDDGAKPSADSVPTAEVQDVTAEAFDNSVATDGCTIMETGPQAAEPRAKLCRSSLELNPAASELTMEKTTSESDPQHQSYVEKTTSESDLQPGDVYPCIPDFGGAAVAGGSRMTEPLSTPGAKTLAVEIPSLMPNEEFFEVGDYNSDSDGEQTSPTPTRRKRSHLTQRTRRSLLSEVEEAHAENLLARAQAVIPPAVPFFNMTEPQKGRHALALSQEPRFEEDPMGLVQELVRGTPKHLQPTLVSQTNRLVIDILKSSEDVPPVPLQSGESGDAREELQLVVYGQKSSEMVVYQEMMRPKNKLKPKVFLDQLTITTFERLMLQGGEAKDTDRDDQKWVEERKLWSDRAHHFNYIMRQVQGDRTFSKWGGSVLDSVVGVFLTQNVSDFLSSNAFMSLRAHYPAREDARTETDVPTEEQSSVTEEITPSVPMDAEIDKQQENASPMHDAGMQDVEVVTEVSITHTSINTFVVEESQQAATCSLSGAETLERSFDINSLVIDLGAVHLGSTSVAALGGCSSTSAAGVLSDEPPPVTATIAETVPGVANTGTPEKGNHSDMASSKKRSILEEKFQISVDAGPLTASATERVLATALRAILGKPKIAREEVVEDQRVPLKMTKYRRPPRNKRLQVNMSRFKTNIKLLTGGERANYELKVNYKLNSEQKVTWEAVRADLLLKKEFGRDPFTADSVDWEAVRRANVAEVAEVIKERGMNNILAGRIKSLLDRVHLDQDASLDLEWVRKLSPINAQNFLTSVRGLGIKSVECIRLLTLHHPSFPVDTNVGRIMVRLGWVPLEPLPEETQLHLLDQYPVQEQIQKYIWPRLCTLDQQTLYEFHYQLITFGKVFCTKNKPNCNACPLRNQCKHFESAYSSARLRLPGPEPGPSHYSQHQIAPLRWSRPSMQTPLGERQSLLMLEGNARASGGACIPIIEEPNSPELYVHDIEDTPFPVNCTDYVELPDVNVELEPSACGGVGLVYVELNETTTQDVSEEFSMEIPIKEGEGSIEDVVEESIPQVQGEEFAHVPSQELVLLATEAAYLPAPPLKNAQRLRTVHYVYELPDHHPLLAKMDKRDPEDPCFYLLAIWNADEVPAATPKISDGDSSNPFACCQSGEESVRGTLLVPCRTAMKGSFPLNGTYFQVNEVFADHASSIVPIEVPRTLLWDLKRRFVYFGTSVTSIFKEMSQEEIQCCFKKGYICVRAFDQSSRHPKPLAIRLHQSGARTVAARTVIAQQQKGRRARKSKVAS